MGHWCTDGTQCITTKCAAGSCACADTDEPCYLDGDCCSPSQSCSYEGNTYPGGVCCTDEYAACTTNAECCRGCCARGTGECYADAYCCSEVGQQCSTPDECCSGHCDMNLGGICT